MLYVAHAHEASAIVQTLVLPRFLPTGPCLALVRHSSIDLLSLATQADTESSRNAAAGLLETVHTVSVHARILSVQLVADPARPSDALAQTLLVLTDHYQPRLIALSASLDPASGDIQVTTKATLALDEAARSPAEAALTICSEPSTPATPATPASPPSGQRIAIAHIYKGILKVVPLTKPQPSVAHHDGDELMQDLGSPSTSVRSADLTRAFGVRLPHPNLLCSAVLSPTQSQAAPAVALLSQSSVPSKIPGFGESCLPVLSFHTVDVDSQDLGPLPWGPPRTPPRAARDDDDDRSYDPQSSSAATQASRDIKPTARQDKSSARKKHGPAAMGARMSNNDLRKREQDWAKSDLANCHVPLPFADAVGAHLIHALPARVGGGVLVFCENSILHVPPPVNKDTPRSPASISPESADLKGKRRKASQGDSFEPRRRSSGALPQPKTSAEGTTTSSSAPSNENGKRRRSSAVAPTSSPSSPTKTNVATTSRARLLRVSLPHPVQVVSAVDMDDASSGTANGCDRFSVLFACSSGALNVVTLTLPAEAVSESSSIPIQPRSMKVATFGYSSQPAGPQAISYLGEGVVCIGSSTGDTLLHQVVPRDVDEAADPTGAQLISPPSSPTQSRRRSSSFQLASSSQGRTELPSAGSLHTIESWQNLGPIVDFVVDDGAGGDPSASSGAQARIVTCSGAGPSGSIREVRTGASVQEVCTIPIPNAQHIWPVHAGPAGSKQTSGILVGFATSTAYLYFDVDGNLVDATDRLTAICGSMADPTLAASSLVDESCSALLLRVAHTDVSLFRCQGGSIALLHQWSPPSGCEITTASANDLGQCVIALSDKSLVYLTAETESLTERGKTSLEHEVSCLDISCLSPGEPAKIAAIGFWQARTIQVLSLPDLSPVGQSSVVQQQLPAVPRSLLLHRFASKQTRQGASRQSRTSLRNRDALSPHLLIGLGDGTLITYSVSLPTDESFSRTVGLFDCKTLSLGTQALKLDAIETSSGARVVAVSGSRPTLVFADSKRFSYNALQHGDQRCVASLYVGAEQVLNAFSLGDSVKLASVGTLQQRDVRTFPLGLDQPLAIAQWPARQVFAVCTWAFLPRGSASGGDKPRGAIRILDHATFEVLDEIRLEPDERPNCIAVMHAYGTEMLVIGTGYIDSQSQETVSGRLVGFDVSPGSSRTKEERGRLRRLFEHDENGNVYSVQSIGNRLAAAVNSEVKIYSVIDPRRGDASSPKIKIKQRGSWASSFIACSLSVVEPDRIVVGDALRSMNVLHVHPQTARVSEIARDCDPFWTSATDLFDDASQTYIGADISFNLYTTQRVLLSDEVKTRMRRAREREQERTVSASDSQGGGRGGGDQYAHVMQRSAVWHYGDMISKFCRSKSWLMAVRGRGVMCGVADHDVAILTESLVPSAGANAAIQPKLIFCTAAGAIGVIAHVRDEEAQLLAKVERNTLSLIESGGGESNAASAGVVGGIRHEEWRTLRTDHRVQSPAGFLDAGVLKMFIDGRLDRAQRDRIVQGPASEAQALGVEREAVEQLIEALGQVC